MKWEKEKVTQTYIIRPYLVCDECGTRMKSTGNNMGSDPEYYEYKCPKCGNVENINELDFPKPETDKNIEKIK